MAFTRITNENLELGQGTGGGFEPYFHPEDIKIVENASDEIIATRVVRAIFEHDDDQNELVVLVGITNLRNDIESDDVVERLSIYDGDDSFAALPCPPLDEERAGIEIE